MLGVQPKSRFPSSISTEIMLQQVMIKYVVTMYPGFERGVVEYYINNEKCLQGITDMEDKYMFINTISRQMRI